MPGLQGQEGPALGAVVVVWGCLQAGGSCGPRQRCCARGTTGRWGQDGEAAVALLGGGWEGAR